MKNKLFSLLLLLTFILSPHSATADSNSITKLVFVSGAVSVKPGEVSDELKVQTQNSESLAETVSETNDVTFSSTSPTGEFLNSSGGAVTKTMSKNTSSRTFYYRDSNIGEYVITTSIKGRETGQTFTATQTIKVGNPIVIDSGTDTNTTATSTNSNTQATSTQSNSTSTNTSAQLSAHSGTVSITYVTPDLEIKADAGRNRIATTKNVIEFDARTSDVGGYASNAKYTWTFGDGRSDMGKRVTHTYLFPGEYNVVLNVESVGKRAVSRTVVKVVDPDVEVIGIDRSSNGFVELRNKSLYEVNIGNWVIDAGGTKMYIAEDTIITEDSSIKIPFSFSNNDVGPVKIVYNDKFVASVFGGEVSSNMAQNTEPTPEEIESAKKEVAEIFARESAVDYKAIEPPTQVYATDTPIVSTQTKASLSDTVEAESIIDMVNKKESNSYLATPVGLFTLIKNFFTK
jgi:hypothetical protein